MGWLSKSPRPTSRTLTGARASLTAAHFMVVKPEPHEHTWNVTAWTARDCNVLDLEREMQEVLARIGGKLLNATIPSGSAEDLARYVQQAMHDVCRVDVEREGRFLVIHEAEPVNQYAGWEYR